MPSPQISSHTVQTNNGKFHSDILTHRKCHFHFPHCLSSCFHAKSPDCFIAVIRKNVDISSLLRSGARVAPTQLSDFFNAVIRKNYCGCQLTPQKWGSGFSNAVIRKNYCGYQLSHSPGSNFFDLSFQEETIVDRSFSVYLCFNTYVHYTASNYII